MSTFEEQAAIRETEVAAESSLIAQRAAIRDRAAENLAKLGGEGRIKGENNAHVRAFFAPVDKNTRFLVKEGKYESIKDPNSPRGTRLTERDGDIWLQFIDGIAVMDTTKAEDQVRLAWCEANPAICRDIEDPMTEAWAYMKELQYPTATHDSRLSPNINIERLLTGDPSGNTVRHRTVDHAREQVSKMNEG